MIRFATAVVLACILVELAAAELQPDEIAVVAARGSRESIALAQYYCRMRGVPKGNVCLVDMPQGETISGEQWTWAVRPEIRKWIIENDPQAQLRCLVTVWDVPLRIGPADPGERFQQYTTFLEKERTARLKRLRELVSSFDQLALDVDLPGATDPADAPDDTTEDLAAVKTQLEAALQRAQRRLTSLPQGDDQAGGMRKLEQLASASGGLGVLMQAIGQRLQNSPPTDAQQAAALRATFEQLRGRVTAYSELKALLEQSPPDIQRDAIVLAVIERAGGLLASVEWLDQQIAIVAKNETKSSFDSELSLVMWPEDYELLRWQPNYLRSAYDNSELRSAYRTLMVARIDAPTLRLAKDLIDTSIKVEKAGLQGKVYFDTRGIGKLDQSPAAVGSYADYDKALLLAARAIEDQSDLEVVTNESPELFQPGDCPEAALYCGWYSLAKYIDAFDWVPGAVAYHLASSEAATLRDPNSEVWCKKLLEDGVCATMGPVYEPYLMAFPRPNEFFPLLLEGELTLVECYYRTKPFNSWMMTLIGDPLYRPFARR